MTEFELTIFETLKKVKANKMSCRMALKDIVWKFEREPPISLKTTYEKAYDDEDDDYIKGSFEEL